MDFWGMDMQKNVVVIAEPALWFQFRVSHGL